jgi:hypothetical protein
LRRKCTQLWPARYAAVARQRAISHRLASRLVLLAGRMRAHTVARWGQHLSRIREVSPIQVRGMLVASLGVSSPPCRKHSTFLAPVFALAVTPTV